MRHHHHHHHWHKNNTHELISKAIYFFNTWTEIDKKQTNIPKRNIHKKWSAHSPSSRWCTHDFISIAPLKHVHTIKPSRREYSLKTARFLKGSILTSIFLKKSNPGQFTNTSLHGGVWGWIWTDTSRGRALGFVQRDRESAVLIYCRQVGGAT